MQIKMFDYNSFGVWEFGAENAFKAFHFASFIVSNIFLSLLFRFFFILNSFAGFIQSLDRYNKRT